MAAAIFLALTPHQAHAKGAKKQKRTLEGVVNLNTATLEQLTMLPGIGPVVAQRILDSRIEKPFERPWELTRVKGIGAKLYRKLEVHLQTSGDSTLRWREATLPARRSKARRRGPKILIFSQPQRPPAASGGPEAKAEQAQESPLRQARVEAPSRLRGGDSSSGSEPFVGPRLDGVADGDLSSSGQSRQKSRALTPPKPSE